MKGGKMKNKKHIGGWIFLAGVILAILFGIALTFANTTGYLNQQTSQIVMIALVIFGLIIGILNVSDEEVGSFLLSGAILVIVSGFGQSIFSLIPVLQSVLIALMAIFVPALIIVAIKNVFVIARD